MIDLLKNLNQTEKFILMASGAMFALAGIYMMIRPSMQDGETKIEIFGLKFNASSGGLIVFLVGTSILIGAALGPENAKTNPKEALLTSAPGESNRVPERTNSDQQRALILPAVAQAKEKESNNTKHLANQITRGFYYRGNINWDEDKEKNDFEDWYIALTSDLHEKNLEIRIRTIGRLQGDYYQGLTGSCVLNIYNHKEEFIKSFELPSVDSAINEKIFIEDYDHILLEFDLYHDGKRANECIYEFKLS